MKKSILILIVSSMVCPIIAVSASANNIMDKNEWILGNTSLNILNGGRIASVDDSCYYSDIMREGHLYWSCDDNEKLISLDDCMNINIVNDTIYYSTIIESQTVVKAIDLEGRIKDIYRVKDGTIKQMYIVNDDTMYYSSDTGIYVYHLDTMHERCVLNQIDIKGFVPEKNGIIYATGSLFHYDIFADGVPIVNDVSIYYTDNGCLIYNKDGNDYQITISDIFEDFDAKYDIQTFQGQQNDLLLLTQQERTSRDDGLEFQEDINNTNIISLQTANDYLDYPLELMSSGINNILKRARQQAEIQWTPKLNVRSFSSTATSATTFYAGTTYTGIPYGQQVNSGLYVPHQASFSTFINAVNDSSSKFYNARGSYGSMDSPYYASDCSAFVSWAYEHGRMTTAGIASSSEFTTVSTSSIYAAEVGDCLNRSSYHVMLITNIGYDSSGNMSSITITEQTPPKIKTTVYSPARLQQIMLNTGYTLKRYNSRNNVQYYKDDNIPIDDKKIPIDLGTNFYAYIFNQPCWKTVACDTNGYNVFLETEKWTANQRWYCTRNSDGSYTFKNAANNRCLDVENAGTSNGTNVQAVGSNGNDAQKWFIYSTNGYYVISPKCAPGKVLDLYSGNTSDGTNVQIYDENDSNAQIFDIYKVDADAGKPEIKSNVGIMKTDGTATVSWNATEYTDHYIYFLTEYPEGYGYTTNTAHDDIFDTSVNFSNLTSGKYSCFIHAVSHQDKWGAQSNWVSFKVYADDYIPTKTVVYNNHIYALYDYEMSWSFARDLCTDLGGHLVTITSADENQVITDLIQSGSKAAYWLGATDIDDTDKNYRWVTGENFSYSNWNSGEPSSNGEDGEKEHFAEVRKSYGNKWNDVNNISKSNKGFILEVEIADYSPTTTETYNGNQYMVFDKNTTWSEAKVFCEQLGGHLVTLESTDEQAFVQGLLKSGDRAWYYIGGQKDNGTWRWYDGRTAEYVPLADNAAQWDGTNLMMYKSTGQCVGLQNAYYPEGDINHIGFVCEIENQIEPIPLQPSEIPAFSLSQHDGYVEIVNDSEIEYTPEIITAKYDNGRLTDVSSTSIAFAAGEKRNISIDSGDIKVFVWSGLKSMIPLTKYNEVLK